MAALVSGGCGRPPEICAPVRVAVGSLPASLAAARDRAVHCPRAARGVAETLGLVAAAAAASALVPPRPCRPRRAGRRRRGGQRQPVLRCTARQCVPGAAALAARSQELVFFGGKGGVGKTSSSAAYAAALAQQGRRVLIISTDPAHSLGDALCEGLSGKPREVADNLFAMEVDPAEALEELRGGLKSIDAKAFLNDLGLPGGTTAALGLEELSEVLESPPPGVDEIAAMAKAAADTEGYDVVVFDTAPTGHTLRMLEVPKFLGDFLDRALSIRKSLGNVLGLVGLGFAAGGVDSKLDEAEEKVREIRARVAWLGKALQTRPGAGGTSAEFVIVTRSQGVCCRRLVVNQIVEAGNGEAYWRSRMDAQKTVLEELRRICASRHLPLLEVSDRPESLVGVPALGYLASLAYSGEVPPPKSEVVLFGGKGGVGKTSMSSALAVRAANEGQRVLILSTDPAHSLGDALGTPLSEEARQVDGFMGAGELWAMEVDTAAAMGRFQATVRDALKKRKDEGGIIGQAMEMLPMEDFVSLFDTLPPGSDEIVALTEVLEEVKKEKFDQIIIDTAPTGHAVRLLSFPDFLERLADRVARLRDRFGWLTGGGGPDQLRSFQFRMIELQELFTDPDRTTFTVVAIPTGLALEESKRLLDDLVEQDIKAGMVVVNRVLDPEQVQLASARLQDSQQASLDSFEALSKREGVAITRVPYMDREVRGIYGLAYLGQKLAEEVAA
ncbi:unnamed protein product [Prorocentrum cordatum]|uniref:AAA+ ATPase domain-containing protein n=1 Tax=Prorocentrum cordatum TaxID=2364126 RepID=A0ABN9TB11_9DINO|nr:unnamed protein product [Polarella glacialis]